MNNKSDVGLAGMVAVAERFPQASVSAFENGVELSFEGVTLSGFFTETGGWDMHFRPFMALGNRLRVSRRNGYLDMGGGVEFKGRIHRKADNAVIWRMRNTDDETFMVLLEALAAVAHEIFDPTLVATDIAEMLMDLVPGGSWMIEGLTMCFCADGTPLLWLGWGDVQNGCGLVDVHLGPRAAVGEYLNPDYCPGENLLGCLTMLNGDTYTGCVWNPGSPPEDGCFTCAFDFGVSRHQLFAFAEGVGRVAAAVPFLY